MNHLDNVGEASKRRQAEHDVDVRLLREAIRSVILSLQHGAAYLSKSIPPLLQVEQVLVRSLQGAQLEVA
jgi:hypothetical protein